LDTISECDRQTDRQTAGDAENARTENEKTEKSGAENARTGKVGKYKEKKIVKSEISATDVTAHSYT